MRQAVEAVGVLGALGLGRMGALEVGLCCGILGDLEVKPGSLSVRHRVL